MARRGQSERGRAVQGYRGVGRSTTRHVPDAPGGTSLIPQGTFAVAWSDHSGRYVASRHGSGIPAISPSEVVPTSARGSLLEACLIRCCQSHGSPFLDAATVARRPSLGSSLSLLSAP